MRIARLQLHYSYVRAAPQPLWTRIFRNIWSRTFYVAPFAMPILTTMVLWLMRPEEFSARAFLVAWWLAAPIGFLLWVAAWKTYGAGTGQVSFAVGATAVFGWCTWHRGVYFALMDGKRYRGILLSVVSMAVMFWTREAIGGGTAPIKLSMMASVTGTGILLSPAMVALAMRFSQAFSERIGTPVWRFLNQPVTFRRV